MFCFTDKKLRRDFGATMPPGFSPPSVRGVSVRNLWRVADMQGVIGEVVSFLEPQGVLTYSMACKVAEGVLRQVAFYDTCDGCSLGLAAAFATAWLP